MAKSQPIVSGHVRGHLTTTEDRISDDGKSSMRQRNRNDASLGDYEVEEEISTPFRSNNRKTGKPSSNSISAYTKADKNGKTIKKTSKY